MDNKHKELVEALVEKPSIYHIDVIDNSMLPKKLKEKSTIKLTVKPATLEVLAKCTIPLLRIPDEIKTSKDIKIDEAIKYVREMAEIIAILSCKRGVYPEWYIDFFINNLTPRELYKLFSETILKLQTGFFLNSFQVANQNPILMKTDK